MSRKPTVLHLFCGAGGGALGFHQAGFRSVGNFDFDPQACQDVEYLTGETATVADLGSMSPQELADACGERPDVVFTSPPCKGFSGCLPSARARSGKYQAMNSLAFRGVWLALEAWETPPPLILLENVPRIQSRGKAFLRELQALLNAYGYAVTMGTHDCGELGGLAQRRRRFLLVARHMEQVPEYLRVPIKKRVRSVGEVLGELPVPLPDSDDGGDMHRLPRMAPINWVRLALIPGGGDWRDLPESVALPARSGRQNGGFGINEWEAPSHAVVAEGTVRNTWSSVADPRLPYPARRGVFGVRPWEEASRVITGNPRMGCGPFAVCDPRLGCSPRGGVLGVTRWTETIGTVIGAARHNNNGSFSIADPRLPEIDSRHAGALGVEAWEAPGHTVTGQHGRRGWDSVADPRDAQANDQDIDWASKKPIHIVIKASDGHWHRPLTTLELAALQGFPTRHRGDWLRLAGNSHRRWRMAIGNAVPPPAAEAIARNCKATLVAASDGTFTLSSAEIWVDPRHDHSSEVEAPV